MVHWAIIIGVVIAAAIVGLSVVPYPNAYNVSVTVESTELSLILLTSYTITGTSGSTTGTSAILDWAAFGLAFGPPALAAVFTMTVCVEGHCASKSQTQWFPSVPFINGATLTATDTFLIGYVPAASQTPITVTLTQSGNVVAQGGGVMCVGAC